MADLNLPILDLSRLDAGADAAERFRDDLRRATHDVGFFYLTGTGVSAELEARLHRAARDFFALPEADKLKITIAIRKGVVFHDGSKLTAADVAASLDRVRATSARWALAPIAAIAAKDAETLEITLRAPVPELVSLLALPLTAITKAGKAPAAEKVVGSGPVALEILREIVQEEPKG
jgi:isopenicillin N synthase-like dioxygenase